MVMLQPADEMSLFPHLEDTQNPSECLVMTGHGVMHIENIYKKGVGFWGFFFEKLSMEFICVMLLYALYCCIYCLIKSGFRVFHLLLTIKYLF